MEFICRNFALLSSLLQCQCFADEGAALSNVQNVQTLFDVDRAKTIFWHSNLPSAISTFDAVSTNKIWHINIDLKDVGGVKTWRVSEWHTRKMLIKYDLIWDDFYDASCVCLCTSLPDPSESYILLNPQSHKLIKVMTLKVISIDLPLMMLYGKETSGNGWKNGKTTFATSSVMQKESGECGHTLMML